MYVYALLSGVEHTGERINGWHQPNAKIFYQIEYPITQKFEQTKANTKCIKCTSWRRLPKWLSSKV